ncbi:MAG: hypothetical protein ACRBCS_03190 [Cellvibrionaceae bacterium]
MTIKQNESLFNVSQQPSTNDQTSSLMSLFRFGSAAKDAIQDGKEEGDSDSTDEKSSYEDENQELFDASEYFEKQAVADALNEVQGFNFEIPKQEGTEQIEMQEQESVIAPPAQNQNDSSGLMGIISMFL